MYQRPVQYYILLRTNDTKMLVVYGDITDGDCTLHEFSTLLTLAGMNASMLTVNDTF